MTSNQKLTWTSKKISHTYNKVYFCKTFLTFSVSDLVEPAKGYLILRQHSRLHLENETFVLPYPGVWMTDFVVIFRMKLIDYSLLMKVIAQFFKTIFTYSSFINLNLFSRRFTNTKKFVKPSFQRWKKRNPQYWANWENYCRLQRMKLWIWRSWNSCFGWWWMVNWRDWDHRRNCLFILENYSQNKLLEFLQ